MPTEEQVKLWVEGKSVHQEECVPDFSCCKPELLQPEEIRIAYARANEKERAKFLDTFVDAAINWSIDDMDKRGVFTSRGISSAVVEEIRNGAIEEMRKEFGRSKQYKVT